MENSKFKKMALIGLLASTSQLPIQASEAILSEATYLTAGGCGGGASGKSGCGRNRASQGTSTQPYTADTVRDMPVQYRQNTANSQPRMMTENELKAQLNDETREFFMRLDPETKALALRYASFQDCSGRSDCNGHPHAFKDKNEAVRAASQKMSEKRARMNNYPSTTQNYNYNQ